MAGLYRLSSLDPAVQARLEGQPGNRTAIRIWGEVRSKAKPVNRYLRRVDRVEAVGGI